MVYPPGPTDDQIDQDDADEEDRIVNRQDSEHAALIGGIGQSLVEAEVEESGDMPGIGEDDGGIVLGKLQGTSRSKKRVLQPWAHRDIKPVSEGWADAVPDSIQQANSMPLSSTRPAGQYHALR